MRAHHDVVDDDDAVGAGVVGGTSEVHESMPVGRGEQRSVVGEADSEGGCGHGGMIPLRWPDGAHRLDRMRRGLMVVTVMCSVGGCVRQLARTPTARSTRWRRWPLRRRTSTIANEPTTVPGTVTTFFYTAFIDSVDLHAHTITIDPMSFLTGAAAKTAFKHDHPTAKEGPPNDYYIVNPTREYLRFPLSPAAVVRLVVGQRRSAHEPGEGRARPIWSGTGRSSLGRSEISGVNGTVTNVVEIFVP